MFTELERLLRAAGMPDLAEKVCGGLAAAQIIAIARTRPGFTAELHEWERAYEGIGTAHFDIDDEDAGEPSNCPRCEGTGKYKRLGLPPVVCAICNGTGVIR